MRNRKLTQAGRSVPVTTLIVVILACITGLALADEIDQEFLFASGLIKLNLADYADKVVQQVLMTHPEFADRAKLIQAEILISRRKFAEAEELVKTMGADNPKAQAISLALARGYYVNNQVPKARELYESFFKRYEGKIPTDPDLLRFYQESAYQYGYMLEMAGDIPGAIKAFGLVLATNLDPVRKRELLGKQTEMMVTLAGTQSGDEKKKTLDDAYKLCQQIQWGGLDVAFGQSVITMAHIEMLRGQDTDAQKVLQSNLDVFKEIDKFLQEEGGSLKDSPMAGARFLLGELIQKNADAMAAAGKSPEEVLPVYGNALTEFYNVFAKYGESDWGPQAGMRAEAIKKILKDKYGRTVELNLKSFAGKASESQFRMAGNLFRQAKYQESANEYLKNLNAYPETDVSATALGSLAMCYANLDDKLFVKMMIQYLAERFAGKNEAALSLLAIGKFYLDRKDEPMYMLAYQTFIDNYPNDQRIGLVLFNLAGLRKQAGDAAAAAKYYQQIVDNHPKDAYYPKALSTLAWTYFTASNYAEAAKGLSSYINAAQPSPDKAQAQLALGDCYRLLNKYQQALVEYEKLIQWLAPKGNPYSTSAADAKKNLGFLEQAAFHKGNCYSRMDEPKEAIPEYRQKGIKAFENFAALFPNSDRVPKALNAKGRILMELGQFDAASKTYNDLAAKFPTTEEGQNALFSMMRSAAEVKQYEQAKTALNKMMAAGDKFTPDQYTRAGQIMLDAQMYPEAIQVYQKAVATGGTDRKVLEGALFGLGSAYYNQKNYQEAVKSLDDLMTRYPLSPLFFDAKFMLGDAYKEIGNYSNAVMALRDVFKMAQNQDLRTKADFALGNILKKQGDKPAALASFLRIALLSDPNNPTLRPIIEKSLLESIDVGLEMGRTQDVLDSCDQYLKVFPSGDQVKFVRQKKEEARLKGVSGTAP